MRKIKFAFYIGLAVLFAAVMGLLLAWNFTKIDALLFSAFGAAAVFLSYFIVLVLINRKSGWSDENTPSYRLFFKEGGLVHLYPYKRRAVAVLYEDCTPEELSNWLKQESKDADMGPIGSVYLGYVRLPVRKLAAVKKKTVVLDEAFLRVLSEREELGEFLRTNRFFKLS